LHPVRKPATKRIIPQFLFGYKNLKDYNWNPSGLFLIISTAGSIAKEIINPVFSLK